MLTPVIGMSVKGNTQEEVQAGNLEYIGRNFDQ